MAGAIVQTATTIDDTGGTSTTIAASLTGVAAGNHVTAHVGWNQTGVTCTVSDGTAYTSANGPINDAVDDQRGQVFYIENHGAGNITVTATFSAAVAFRRIRVVEISGLATSASLDGNAGQHQATPGTAANGVTSGNTATTTNANDFLLGFSQDTDEIDPGSGTMSAGTNYTLGTGSGNTLAYESRSVAATAAYAATFTASVDGDRITHVVAFKEAGGGAIAAAGTLSISGIADLDATGTLVAAGALSITGVADLDAIGTLTAVGSLAITGVADLTSANALIASGTIVISGVADLTGSIRSAETFTGGFLIAFEREMRRKDAARRKRKRELEEAKEIQDAIDREIAVLLRKQEAQDAEQLELARLSTLVAQFADRQAEEAFSERIRVAFARAAAQQNASALLALDREVRRAMEEDEFAVLVALALED